MQTVTVADQESQLLKLARKQGMNTDIRRGIFVVLMSSEVGWNSMSYGVFSNFPDRIIWMRAKGSDS